MKTNPEILALEHAHAACKVHDEALGDALEDIGQWPITETQLDHLTKDQRRLLDQFAYRYTRLQDALGARLMPAALRALGEDIEIMPALDRFNRLEQLGWLPSADEWLELRRIRNEFAHDYPEMAKERFDQLQLALAAARRAREIFNFLGQKVLQRLAAAKR